MDRRQFLKTAAAACVVQAASPVFSQTGPRAPRMTFYIAGVRYNRIAVIPEGACPLQLVWEATGTTAGCAILDPAAQRLGYVPQRALSKLKAFRKPAALLAEVDRYAVPWKRYRVTITETGANA